MCVCVCEGDLPMSFDAAECLNVDEALRLGLSPLDLNDLQLLSDCGWVDADAAEHQLRLDRLS